MSGFATVPAAPEIPAFRARFLFGQRRERARATDAQLTASQAYGVIAQAKYNELSDTRATAALAGTDSFLHVDVGDFVISLRTFEGGIERAREEGCISPAYTVMRPTDRVEPDFFRYLLKSSAFIQTLQTAVTGIRDGKSVRYEQFSDLVLPTPDLPTQKRIAAYLDRKTSTIDTLISKKKDFVERLKERRAAMITAAVTGRLDPETGESLEDGSRRGAEGGGRVSGFELARHLPEPTKQTWSRSRFKHILREVDERNKSSNASEKEGLLGLSKARGVLKKDDMDQRASEAGDYSKYKKVRAGQLVSNKMQAWNGMFGISPFDGFTSPDYAIYEFRGSVDRSFIEYAIRSPMFAAEFHCRSRGMGTGFLRLNPAEFLATEFYHPDLPTQKRIAAFLDREIAKIDSLICKLDTFVDQLVEKRAALITAAVTGQIDLDTDDATVDASVSIEHHAEEALA